MSRRIADGALVPVVGTETTTYLVLADTRCVACRIQLREQIAWARRLRARGYGARILVTNKAEAAEQFARLGQDTDVIAAVGPEFFERLGVIVTPSVLKVDSSGVIRSAWNQWNANIQLLGVSKTGG